MIIVSIHALLAECDFREPIRNRSCPSFNPRTPCGVRPGQTGPRYAGEGVSIHALLAECDKLPPWCICQILGFNPRTPCGVRPATTDQGFTKFRFNPRTPCGVRQIWLDVKFNGKGFQSTHSLRSATAPNLIHCYSTKQIILCANLPKKTVIARLLFLSIYLSIFYSQCITPIADLPGNSCELEVGAQAMFNSL